MRLILERMKDTFKNRNPGLRGQLPIQTDLLDGGQVEMWSWPVRLFNAISPVQLSGKDSEVRRKFRETGFDLKLFATTDSLGNKMDRDMTKLNGLRSLVVITLKRPSSKNHG